MSDQYMSSYLKCDAEGCDHVEEVDEITEDHIGKPCPKCGASLLTEEDYHRFNVMKAGMRMLGRLGLVRKPDGDNPAEGEVIIKTHHHAGKTTIEEITNDQ